MAQAKFFICKRVLIRKNVGFLIKNETLRTSISFNKIECKDEQSETLSYEIAGKIEQY